MDPQGRVEQDEEKRWEKLYDAITAAEEAIPKSRSENRSKDTEKNAGR